MNNNSSNNTWTVNFILNANVDGGGDAIVTLINEGIYEVEVLGDLVGDTDTIEEAFALAEDMISFHDAVSTVTVEVEEEIENLEKELEAVDTISHLLSLVDSMNIVGFLHEEIDEQLEFIEALENYTYDMFVEDRWDAGEEAVIEMIDEALAEEESDAIIDAVIDMYVENFESFLAATEKEEEVNGNVRGPFSVV